MKKYLLGLFAVALAVGFSAFTKSTPVNAKLQPSYYIYDEVAAGPQTSPSSYTIQNSIPDKCEAASKLCWFKVEENETFSEVFQRLDVNTDGEITISDLLTGEDGQTVELRQ